ncbi:MAG: hemolysin family protein [Eubacteriales bacterium]|nr:hemolysin family protein [Eubacteriales bacterium]
MDPDTGYAVQLLVLAFLVLINAFFAAAEMAIVSSNRNKIKIHAQSGNKNAVLVQELIDSPNQFLSTIQIAITLAGFLSSAFAAVSMSGDFGKFLASFGIPYPNQIAVVVVTLILSYFTLVLGELYPKRIGLQHAEKIAMFVVKPIMVISKIAKPFVSILSVSLNFLLKLTRQNINVEEDEFSEDEVKSMLEVGRDTGVLKEEGRKMIDSIFAFDDKLAYEIMTPRTDVFAIDIEDPIEEFIEELMELHYSRIPVYDNDLDNIIGILNIKDYFVKAKTNGFYDVNIREILRKPYFVPETKTIDSLFFDLKGSKNQIAILIDEYGGFSGIVTTEDLIEEIVGDIEDEYDDENNDIEQISENAYVVDGFAYIDDINENLGLNLNSEDSETIGGLIIDLLGEIPDEKEKNRIVEYGNCIFTILSVKERRIEKLKIEILETQEPSESDNNEDKNGKN